MVRSCAAFGCTNRHEKDKDRRFHKFPIGNPGLMKKWIVAMKRESFVPKNYNYLCSDHFTPDCYKSQSKCWLLKHDAVPSIFKFPPSHQRSTKERRKITKYIPTPTENQEDMPLYRNEDVNTSNAEEVMQSVPGCSADTSPALRGTSEDIHLTLHQRLQIQRDRFSRLRHESEKQLKRKVKLLQQKLKRRNKRITNLVTILETAKKFCGMTENTSGMLKDTFGQIPFEILINQAKNYKRSAKGRRYSSTMKEFALTLYFYSPRSYNFLRTKINLPHASVIRSWVSSLNCYPGFIGESFKYLEELSSTSKFEDCALIIDSMSIRKQIIWDKPRNKYSGYVECVGLLDDRSECLASEALVFIVVSFTQRFKYPVAYFLIDKINSNVLAQLIKTCITKLSQVGLRVWSVTADGLSTNLAAFQVLGCKIQGYNVNKMQTYFMHPTLSEPVYIIFDPCHMLKLARNLLAEKKFISSKMGAIYWHYIQSLCNLQNDIGFKFANKLSSAHVNFQNKKMNVSLAAQTLSSGTADAIEFLSKTKDPKFLGAEATIEFIRVIDRIFDLCNSRNPFGKHFKSPLSLKNKDWWMGIFSDTIDYLITLTVEGVQILHATRKMFALGFITTIKSLSLLVPSLLTQGSKPLKYFLTYKVSQDHIELFFNNIRASGGYNNNPNACQFRWALRKLLLCGNVAARNSNCLDSDTEIPSSIIEFRTHKRAMIDITLPDDTDEALILTYSQLLSSEKLTDYQNNILYYIGGYIVKNILKKCSCIKCHEMLLEEINEHDYSVLSINDPKYFLKTVTRGGLKFCSQTVFKVICAAERAFKSLIMENNPNPNINNTILQISTIYLRNKGVQFQHEIQNEIGCEELHETQMIRKIIEIYVKIRLQSYGKILTLKQVHGYKSTIRQKLTKLITFKNV